MNRPTTPHQNHPVSSEVEDDDCIVVVFDENVEEGPTSFIEPEPQQPKPELLLSSFSYHGEDDDENDDDGTAHATRHFKRSLEKSRGDGSLHPAEDRKNSQVMKPHHHRHRHQGSHRVPPPPHAHAAHHDGGGGSDEDDGAILEEHDYTIRNEIANLDQDADQDDVIVSIDNDDDDAEDVEQPQEHDSKENSARFQHRYLNVKSADEEGRSTPRTAPNTAVAQQRPKLNHDATNSNNNNNDDGGNHGEPSKDHFIDVDGDKVAAANAAVYNDDADYFDDDEDDDDEHAATISWREWIERHILLSRFFVSGHATAVFLGFFALFLILAFALPVVQRKNKFSRFNKDLSIKLYHSKVSPLFGSLEQCDEFEQNSDAIFGIGVVLLILGFIFLGGLIAVPLIYHYHCGRSAVPRSSPSTPSSSADDQNDDGISGENEVLFPKHADNDDDDQNNRCHDGHQDDEEIFYENTDDDEYQEEMKEIAEVAATNINPLAGKPRKSDPDDHHDDAAAVEKNNTKNLTDDTAPSFQPRYPGSFFTAREARFFSLAFSILSFVVAVFQIMEIFYTLRIYFFPFCSQIPLSHRPFTSTGPSPWMMLVSLLFNFAFFAALQLWYRAPMMITEREEREKSQRDADAHASLRDAAFTTAILGYDIQCEHQVAVTEFYELSVRHVRQHHRFQLAYNEEREAMVNSAISYMMQLMSEFDAAVGRRTRMMTSSMRQQENDEEQEEEILESAALDNTSTEPEEQQSTELVVTTMTTIQEFEASYVTERNELEEQLCSQLEQDAANEATRFILFRKWERKRKECVRREAKDFDELVDLFESTRDSSNDNKAEGGEEQLQSASAVSVSASSPKSPKAGSPTKKKSFGDLKYFKSQQQQQKE